MDGIGWDERENWRETKRHMVGRRNGERGGSIYVYIYIHTGEQDDEEVG